MECRLVEERKYNCFIKNMEIKPLKAIETYFELSEPK